METPSFSLEFFRQSAGGNIHFMRRLLKLTAQELSTYFDQFANAVQEGNRQQIARLRHKLHPHLEALQATELEQLVQKLSEGQLQWLTIFQQKAILLCKAIQQASHEV
ncbi:MAG: hypothetical protein RMJ44_09165 [Cytophagales bacterium]|nr:hypothetical protein [Bernardetiaceae bacterium]MDW8211244.1 hypothetical protein [Cytophagales bacterium]